MKAKCKKCGDTVEVTRPREFKSCKCGAINLDYGDEFYYRVGGNPEDFDGEIEDAPEIHHPRIITTEHPHPEQTITTIRADVACDENTEDFDGEIEDVPKINDDLVYRPEVIKIDSFWTEMAEHFKAMAKLCEEKSESR